MNISEVAKLAGVSPATVSRYLNDGYVSEEKREAIRRVIDETGYTPLQSAQAIRTKKYNLIGVIVPRMSSEAVPRMVAGITEALEGTPYNILFANTDLSTEKEVKFLELFRNNIVDGVILCGTMLTRKHHAILKNYTKPFVLLGQFDKQYSSVYYDDYGAAYALTKHLAENGCKKIACVHCTVKDKAAGKARLDGYSTALKDMGMTLKEKLLSESTFEVQGGYRAIKALMESGETFDGVFCATDFIAFGAKKYLQEKGIRVGKDMKICGVGAATMTQHIVPALTTVDLNHTMGGMKACQMILNKLANRTMQTVEQCKLGFKIIERDSTKVL